MVAKNKYAKRSKISEAKFRKLIQHFASDLDAKTIATLTRLNRNTVNRYLTFIRKRIAEFCDQQSPVSSEVEDFKCYIGFNCNRRKRNQRTDQNTSFYRILKNGGKVYTEPVTGKAARTPTTFEEGIYHLEIVSQSDSRNDNDDVNQLDFKSHSAADNFTSSISHINPIERFWSFAKVRLIKFHGVPQSTYYLHLKECEFRYNYRNENIYPILLKMIRENPLG